MQFKIRNTEIKLSFSFFALILLFLTIDFDRRLVLAIIFAFVHEAVHLVFINKFSVAPKKVSLNLFGADILRSNDGVINNNTEILIHLSAPLFNLTLGVVFYLLHKTLVSNILIEYSAEVNFVLGIFNLIPFYNFDGGNALNNLLLKFCNTKATDLVMTTISVIVTILFSIASVIVFIKFKHNTSLMLMSGYMIFSIIFKK